jgi:hypothetical protein
MRTFTIVALVLAAATSFSSSSAGPQPREERGGRVPYNPKWNPRPPPLPPHRAGDWVTLATPTPTRFGTEWISVGPNAGAFRTLRIEAVSGTVHLRRVQVDLASGKVLTFNLDRWLDRRHPHARIELGAPYFIDNIVVTTARNPAGSYAVSGSWSLTPAGDLVAFR